MNDDGNGGDDRALLPFEGDGDGAPGAGRLIRRQWHDGRWFFSVVDVVAVLTDSPIPRNYWSDLKRRLAQDEGFSELHAKIVQLKMRSLDGKRYATDAADTETLLRIMQSIPSPKVEPFKQWLARVGKERLAEVDDPALAAERLRKEYQRLGYRDAWIDERLKNIVTRNALTDEWRERGAGRRKGPGEVREVVRGDAHGGGSQCGTGDRDIRRLFSLS